MLYPIPGLLVGLSTILNGAKSVVIAILVFAVVFGILAFCHEFGHFLLAKMLGMTVEQFGIGFPPNIGWTVFRRSGTSYTIHPAPLGAFVKIQGMDPGDQSSPNAFMKQPAWARLIVFLAGSAGNMVLAVVVYAVLALAVGAPVREYATNEVMGVQSGSPAAKAGFKPGDHVLAIRRASEPTKWIRPRPTAKALDATALVQFIHRSWVKAPFPAPDRGASSAPRGATPSSRESANDNPGSKNGSKSAAGFIGIPLVLEVQRGSGAVFTVRATPEVTIGLDHKPQAHLGYYPQVEEQDRPVNVLEAAAIGFDQARDNAGGLIQILVDRTSAVVHRRITPNEFGQQFGGTVMIAQASTHAAAAGFAPFLSFVAFLSINLAVLNLLPLPVFDGGNIMLVLVEIIRRKQLEPRQFLIVQMVGLAFILCLFAYLTYNDILRSVGSLTP